MTNRFGKWVAVPALFLALAACSGDDKNSASEGSPKDESYVKISEPQGSVEGFVGANDDATMENCKAKGKSWVSDGTVKNSAKDTQSYRIYVAFNRGKDTQGLVQTDLKSVAAGDTAKWKVEAPISGEDLSCVLRVERFDPQS